MGLWDWVGKERKGSITDSQIKEVYDCLEDLHKREIESRVYVESLRLQFADLEKRVKGIRVKGIM